MRLLERDADISTRYGGGFVQSIDGLAGGARGRSSRLVLLRRRGRVAGRRRRLPAAGRRGDLVGLPRLVRGAARAGGGRLLAAAVPRRLRRKAASGGGRVRRAGAQPAAGRGRLERAGVAVAAGSPDGAIRVLVGPWARLRPTRPRRSSRRGCRRAGSSRTSPSAGGRLRAAGARRSRRAGARLRPRRRARRRHPPLRSAAGLAGDRGDGAGGARAPPACSMPPICATITRWRRRREGDAAAAGGPDEIAVRLHAEAGPAAGGLAGRRGRLPRLAGRRRLPLLEPAGAGRGRRRRGPRRPARRAPAARCAARCGWA